MGTYVMSDIHGCLDDFQKMLDKIEFSGRDLLYLAGDYIDRGKQNIEMLRWLMSKPKNVTAIKGNHDVEFCAYIDMMKHVDESEGLYTDYEDPHDTELLYQSTVYALDRVNPLKSLYFDHYRTVQGMVKSGETTFSEMLRWRDMLGNYPYYIKKRIGRKLYVIVHAGYCEDITRIPSDLESEVEFYIYAREEGLAGGIKNGTVIFGHTPTVFEDTPFYAGGRIFRYHDEEKNCTFIDIDGGCAYRGYKRGSRLACLRLEDESVFYV